MKLWNWKRCDFLIVYGGSQKVIALLIIPETKDKSWNIFIILLDSGCYERRTIKYEIKSTTVRGGQSQKGNYHSLFIIMH